MTDGDAEQRWQQVERLFHAALERRPDERAAFLDAACGTDPQLHAEVAAMLVADSGAAGVLDRPLEPDADAGAPLSVGLAAGQLVGVWRVLSELGRGGMGVVYLAERFDGTYEQQVALKVIRGGLFAALNTARFLRERRILGRLRHPNIARLLDAGSTSDGLPYLVMELISGEPITVWANKQQLDTDARLRLILQVCEALQHAHRNLVVHRDLKPGNILVTDEGDVRLLDFGVAHLLAGPEEDGQALTRSGYLPMTPEYAAPEQLEGHGITTATDVFSLGTILFELLTNRRPRERVGDSPADLVRALQTEIAAPSKAPGLTDAQRRQLRGDLDAIVQRATAADPERRYASIADFADDIRRFRKHQPIEARPDTFRYRTGKYLRRHRVGAAALAAVVAAIAIGGAATVWQAREATAQAHKAEAVKDFVLGLFEGADPSRALGQELTAQRLVDDGAARIQTELIGEPEVRAEILTFLADMYDRMDQDERAIELIEQAIAVQGDTADLKHAQTLLVKGRILIGKSEDASGVAALQRAMPILRANNALLDTAEAMDVLSISSNRNGDVAGAIRLTEGALALRVAELGEYDPLVATSYNNLGVLARAQGNYAGSREHHQRALEIRRRTLPGNHPQIAVSLNNLGALDVSEGHYASASDYFAASLDVNRQVNGPTHHDTIAALNNFGYMQMRLGNLAAAEKAFSDVYGYWVAQGKSDHPNALVTRVNIATLWRVSGDIGRAMQEYRQLQVQLTEKLGADHPFVAATLHHQARCLLELGRLAEARTLVAQALALREKAVGRDHPDNAELLRDQAVIALLESGPTAARPLAERAMSMQRSKLPANHPSIAMTEVVLGRITAAEGNASDAVRVQRDALRRLEAVFPAQSPERVEAALELSRSLVADGKGRDAEPYLRSAREALVARFGRQSRQVTDVDLLLAQAGTR
ncbi:MAG TPA: serine/threonine-protein kinase [Steroidobacteraceae bacterium]|nr:serine/threonine-protein kinase [Steroidobacteraceae bacterium]HRX89561.1 serine/threonine-protein kinase [Steroidobacteraceae bacterium]